LASAKQKLSDLVTIHLKTLALKRKAGITADAYARSMPPTGSPKANILLIM
jgi:hypothetical protein